MRRAVSIEEIPHRIRRRSPSHDRPPGVHLSNVLDVLDAARGVTHPNWGPTAMDMGCAVEDFLEEVVLWEAEQAEGEVGWRPDPVLVDGIWCSADRVVVDAEYGLTVEEHKVKWKSLPKEGIDHEKFWREWVQLMAYCWAHETVWGVFRVVFVCGDWKPPMPVPKAWRMRFDPRDLKGVWDMVLGTARREGMV